jgi:hypothetical protein
MEEIKVHYLTVMRKHATRSAPTPKKLAEICHQTSGLYKKIFMIVNYDHNAIGQYYNQ